MGVITYARVDKSYILVFTIIRMENTKTNKPVKDTKDNKKEKVEKVETKKTDDKKVEDNKKPYDLLQGLMYQNVNFII